MRSSTKCLIGALLILFWGSLCFSKVQTSEESAEAVVRKYISYASFVDKNTLQIVLSNATYTDSQGKKYVGTKMVETVQLKGATFDIEKGKTAKISCSLCEQDIYLAGGQFLISTKVGSETSSSSSAVVTYSNSRAANKKVASALAYLAQTAQPTTFISPNAQANVSKVTPSASTPVQPQGTTFMVPAISHAGSPSAPTPVQAQTAQTTSPQTTATQDQQTASSPQSAAITAALAELNSGGATNGLQFSYDQSSGVLSVANLTSSGGARVRITFAYPTSTSRTPTRALIRLDTIRSTYRARVMRIAHTEVRTTS